MKISVVTPTIRKAGLDIVRRSLEQQSLQDFEWLIGSKFDPQIPNATWVVDDFTGGYWTLNRIMTKLCKEASGELVVFLQDYIYVPPKGLEKFWINYQATNGAISGVGDQYARVNEYGKPVNKIWLDPRRNDKYGSFYECFPDDLELNWACVGKRDLEKVNYFVDQADFEGYGMDNVLLSEKLDREGVKFFIDQTNESYTLRHERERKDWDENYILRNGGMERLNKNVV